MPDQPHIDMDQLLRNYSEQRRGSSPPPLHGPEGRNTKTHTQTRPGRKKTPPTQTPSAPGQPPAPPPPHLLLKHLCWLARRWQRPIRRSKKAPKSLLPPP